MTEARLQRGSRPPRTLLTGATGYVGGQLRQVLESRGVALRCLTRAPERLRPRVAAGTEVVGGDAVRGEGLADALHGIETAYYLIHSMDAAADFEARDRAAARNFGDAARRARVRRIVYLGGLADPASDLSAHLRSRIEVGEQLRESGVPVIELRASIVLGAGSLSFEMIRALVDHLPVMVTPCWVDTLAQPIGIDDLLAYLVQAGAADPARNPIYEIGGADRVSYGDLMREYARQRGLRRRMLRVPVLTPWLSSLWLGLVTPLQARVGRKLIDSIRQPTVVRDASALREFRIVPVDVRTAMASALAREAKEEATRPRRLVDAREAHVARAREAAFAPIQRIGGATGWYAYGWLWRLRGLVDVALGGVGLRRGRRDALLLRIGDTLDWWRVVAFEPGSRLRLEAEMKLPGRAWLEFDVRDAPGGAVIRQMATFEPDGLAGLAYWYGIFPLHALIFAGMLRGIARAALCQEPHPMEETCATPTSSRTSLLTRRSGS